MMLFKSGAFFVEAFFDRDTSFFAYIFFHNEKNENTKRMYDSRKQTNPTFDFRFFI